MVIRAADDDLRAALALAGLLSGEGSTDLNRMEDR